MTTAPTLEPLIVDCSAVTAIMFGEPAAADIRAQTRNRVLVAPPLLRYELANATWKKVRMQGWLHDEALTLLSGALSLPIRYHDVDYVSAARLGMETGLTAYDASYLWLAETRGLELIALDGPLMRAYAARR